MLYYSSRLISRATYIGNFQVKFLWLPPPQPKVLTQHMSDFPIISGLDMNEIQGCSIPRPIMESSSSDSQIVVPKPVASGAPGTLLKGQILRSYPDILNQKIWECVFISPVIWTHGQVWELLALPSLCSLTKEVYVHILKWYFLILAMEHRDVRNQSTGWIPAP